jgi:hypothetical protein
MSLANPLWGAPRIQREAYIKSQAHEAGASFWTAMTMVDF